jgi:hypothetical protein
MSNPDMSNLIGATSFPLHQNIEIYKFSSELSAEAEPTTTLPKSQKKIRPLEPIWSSWQIEQRSGLIVAAEPPQR